jgi:hypothetical protein
MLLAEQLRREEALRMANRTAGAHSLFAAICDACPCKRDSPTETAPPERLVEDVGQGQTLLAPRASPAAAECPNEYE